MFALCVRACGMRVRSVHDWTDHVWVEVYCGDEFGWVHADSCEDVMDEPLLYEKGWGKKLNYCIATGLDVVVDVTPKYTQHFDAIKSRRVLAEEGALQRGLKKMNDDLVRKLSKDDAEAALKRYREEEHAVSVGEAPQLPARQSGSASWVQARGEDGSRN